MALARSPRLWLSVLSLVAVLWILLHDLGERTSPGQLSATHLALAELAGAEGCDACHGEGPDDLARACSDCHVEVGGELREGSGFHGTLSRTTGAARAAEVAVEDCGACHQEHHGADFPPVSERSFELAGFAGRAGFDHGRLDYLLEGEHAGLDCVACHELADAFALDEGQRRFGGLERSCAPCHEDPHQGAMARACGDCHGPAEDWHELANFEHDAAFPLTDAHALVGSEGCRACHDPDGEHAVERLAAAPTGGGQATDPRRCDACHDSPHDPAFLALADGPTAASPGACATCHTPHPDGFGPASLAGTGLDDPLRAAALHAATGFALEVPHADLDCGACHGEPHEPFAQRFPGRAAEDCAACHEDPHQGANGPSCVDCHQPAGPWLDLSRFAHRDDVPLDGVHGQLACAACHEPTGPTSVAALDLRLAAGEAVAARACGACHDDPHDPVFLTGVAALLPVPTADATCAACHDPGLEPLARGGPGFAVGPDDLPVDLHAASGFDLETPHADLACAACHAEPEASFDERFLPADHARAPEACAACHEDPHGGRLADSALVAAAGAAADPDGCRACHLDAAFVPSRVDAALHAASGFPLDGAHDAVGCFGCHEPGPDVARFAGTPSSCVACHDDVHDGAFEATCASCHVTSSFHDRALTAGEAFDHGGLVGFELAGAHARAACEACHGPEPDGPGARRFGRVGVLRPGDPARCVTCHDDPHAGAFDAGPDAVGGVTGCARCHDQESFRLGEGAPFDHDLWTAFALEGPHAAAACADCHGRTPGLAGGTTLGPAAGGACADCHADVHLGQFRRESEPATDCARCHAAADGGWSAARFDHAASFPLDPTHAPLDCAACHRAWPLDGGGQVVRYRPLGRTCEACHGTPVPGGQR